MISVARFFFCEQGHRPPFKKIGVKHDTSTVVSPVRSLNHTCIKSVHKNHLILLLVLHTLNSLINEYPRLKFLYKNTPMCGLALRPLLLCHNSDNLFQAFIVQCKAFWIPFELSHNFYCKISQMFCFDNARPRLGAFLYKNFNDNDFSYRPFNFSSNK